MGFWSLAVNRSTRGLRGTWGEKLGEGWVHVFDVAPENQAAVKMRVRKGFVVASGVAISIGLADAFGLAADALDHGANLMDIITGVDHADTTQALLPSPDGAFPDDSFSADSSGGFHPHAPDSVRFGEVPDANTVHGTVLSTWDGKALPYHGSDGTLYHTEQDFDVKTNGVDPTGDEIDTGGSGTLEAYEKVTRDYDPPDFGQPYYPKPL